MGKLKLTITGTATKKPKINEDGTVNLIIKTEMNPSVPKGLKSLGESLCLIHISKKTWQKVSDSVTDDSFYIIQGEGKSRVNSKQTPFLEVVAFDISLKKTNNNNKKEDKKINVKSITENEIKVNDDKPKIKLPDNKNKVKDIKKIPMFSDWYDESDIKYVSYTDIVLTEDIHLKTKIMNLNSILYMVNKSEKKEIYKPLAVKKVEDKYSLVMGFRSFMVAKILQLDKVPIVETTLNYTEFTEKYKIKKS